MPEPSQNKIDAYEINLLDVAIVLAKYKKFIIALPLITAIIFAIVTSKDPDTFQAETTFMPPKKAESVSSLVSSLGSLGSISGMLGGGGGIGAGIGAGNELYIAILKSRDMQYRLVKRFNLLAVYKTTSLEGARQALNGQTQIKTEKSGLIALTITDTDPKRAALLANGYTEELMRSNNELALSDAAQQRRIAEIQLLKAKNTLTEAETVVKQLQESTGLITVGPEVAVLQSMISTTQRQLKDMSLATTPGNSEYIKTQHKLTNLQAEIGKAQSAKGYISKAPERILDFMHKTRDLKYAEALYQMAMQTLTAAKMNELTAGSTIQVIDRAIPPAQTSGPNRNRTVLIAFIAALFAAIIIAFLLEAIERSKQNPESTTQYQTIKNHLKTWK